MAVLDYRATLREVALERHQDLLLAVVAVLLAELNDVRARLIPPLSPLTPAGLLAKVKAQL